MAVKGEEAQHVGREDVQGEEAQHGEREDVHQGEEAQHAERINVEDRCAQGGRELVK